jgi:hypothetical protein
MTAMFVMLVLIGVVGSILSYYFYRDMKNIRVAKVTPLIEEQFDFFYQLCEQAINLWA